MLWMIAGGAAYLLLAAALVLLCALLRKYTGLHLAELAAGLAVCGVLSMMLHLPAAWLVPLLWGLVRLFAHFVRDAFSWEAPAKERSTNGIHH